MTSVLHLLKENLYWIVFVATLLDHSGLPVPIVTSGIYVSSAPAELPVLLVIINAAFLLSDLALMALGAYLKKGRQSAGNNRFSLFYSTELKVTEFGDKILEKGSLLVYFFGKFVPYLGKFLPVFIGYSKGFRPINILLLFIGNNIYILTFTIAGVFFGSIILKYSALAAIVLFVLFVLAYLVIIQVQQKRWKG